MDLNICIQTHYTILCLRSWHALTFQIIFNKKQQKVLWLFGNKCLQVLRVLRVPRCGVLCLMLLPPLSVFVVAMSWAVLWGCLCQNSVATRQTRNRMRRTSHTWRSFPKLLAKVFLFPHRPACAWGRWKFLACRVYDRKFQVQSFVTEKRRMSLLWINHESSGGKSRGLSYEGNF